MFDLIEVLSLLVEGCNQLQGIIIGLIHQGILMFEDEINQCPISSSVSSPIFKK